MNTMEETNNIPEEVLCPSWRNIFSLSLLVVASTFQLLIVQFMVGGVISGFVRVGEFFYAWPLFSRPLVEGGFIGVIAIIFFFVFLILLGTVLFFFYACFKWANNKGRDILKRMTITPVWSLVLSIALSYVIPFLFSIFIFAVAVRNYNARTGESIDTATVSIISFAVLALFDFVYGKMKRKRNQNTAQKIPAYDQSRS